LAYEQDLQFISPAQANAPDYFVLINDKVCKDMTGQVGICALRHSESSALKFKLLAQGYGYKLDFRCGNAAGIVFRKMIDVLPEKELEFEIDAATLKGQGYLNCIGDISPTDRQEPIASFFEARIRLSVNYIPPSEIYSYDSGKKKYLVLGKNAYRSTIVTDDNKTYQLKEQTIFKFKTNIKYAISESYTMRRAYYGDILK
jgi:hypothetical protein